MAKAKTKATKSPAVSEDTEGTKAIRSQTWIHDGQAEWLEAEGHDLSDMSPGEIIALGHARRNAYRKSDFYVNLKAEHADDAEAAKAAKVEAREAAKAEKAAAKAASKPKATKTPKGRKSAKAKATDEGDEEDPFE